MIAALGEPNVVRPPIAPPLRNFTIRKIPRFSSPPPAVRLPPNKRKSSRPGDLSRRKVAMDWDSPAADATEPVWLHRRIAARRNPLELAEPLATRVRYSRGQAIYEEDSTVECWCRIVSGVARRFSLRVDGRRQIVDLLLPDDVFGFGTRGRHRFAVEAAVDGTVVARYPRARLETLAASDVRVAQQLQEASTQAMARLQTLILTLGRTTAEAKVGCFLLRMAERLSAGPPDAAAIADFARRYRRLPRALGRDRQPVSDPAEAPRLDPASRHAADQDRRSRGY